jgi:chemotaxis response regulator CheB
MRRVLLVFFSGLFGRGMEELLSQEPGLEVWTCEADASSVVDRFHTLKPDVIIVEHREMAADLGDALRQMLRICERLVVIELDLAGDSAHIYSGQQQAIRQVGDLLGAIKQPYTPDERLGSAHHQIAEPDERR